MRYAMMGEAMMVHAVRKVGTLSDRILDVTDDLPFRGVVFYLVPERNFGVILTADGLEIYFLRSSVSENNFDALEPGSRVHFDLSSGILGLQARRVCLENVQSLRH